VQGGKMRAAIESEREPSLKRPADARRPPVQ
jgi:hypothetical protein